MLVDPELAKVFPDTASVNRALRVLRDAAGSKKRGRESLFDPLVRARRQ